VLGAVGDLKKLLVGSNLLEIRKNWEICYCHSYWRGGPIVTRGPQGPGSHAVGHFCKYSNRMRGQRLKQTDAEVVAAPEGEVIDVSAFKPRRIPSKKWRELIKKVWEADPLL